MEKVPTFYDRLEYICYGHLVYFMAIWKFGGNLVIFPRLVYILYQEKSGNLGVYF
jgi:hypothetical protein